MFRDVLMLTLQNELRGIFELRKEIELWNGHQHEENGVGSQIIWENNMDNSTIGTGVYILLASFIGV